MNPILDEVLSEIPDEELYAVIEHCMERLELESDYPVELLTQLTEFASVRVVDHGGDGTRAGCPININSQTRNELAQHLVTMHKLRRRVRDWDTVLSSNLDAVAKRLGEILDDEGLEKLALRGPDGSTLANIKLDVSLYAGIKKDVETQAHEWLRQNELGALIKLGVNQRSLTSAITEYLANGGAPPPEELFSVFTTQKAKITKTY